MRLLSKGRGQQQQAEDAVTFGSRLRFVDIALYDEEQATTRSTSSSLPWPCLQFANVVEMLSVMQAHNNDQLSGRMSCPHLLHRINVEYLRHLQDGGQDDDPVVFLFGKLTPRGNRLIFDCCHADPAVSTHTTTTNTASTASSSVAAAAASTTPATTSANSNNGNEGCCLHEDDNECTCNRRNDDNDQQIPPVSPSRRPLQLHDYKDCISAAVDQMQGEPCFMNALNETSPILASLLSEEMQSPHRLPGPGEHAPAA
jgi:hypothetical protein